MFPYIAWDPGKIRIGVAGFTEDGTCAANTQIDRDILDGYLKKLREFIVINPDRKPKVFIIEDYRVFSHKLRAHAGSKLETARILGFLEGFARIEGIEVVLQPSSILGVTQMWSGVRMPSDHTKSDKVSAYLHGYHYLHKKGIIKARVLEDSE